MQKFKELLNEQIEFPSTYTFKFVAPAHATGLVKRALYECEISERESRTGRYVSVTGKKTVSSSDEILSVYEKVSKIEGIVSL